MVEPSPSDPSSSSPFGDVATVLAANAEFYRAFEAQDLDAMEVIWEDTEDLACTHPGWPMLHGRGPVLTSWRQILTGPGRLQFILTDERVTLEGDVAWVTGVENLLGDDGPQGAATVINIFRRRGGSWRLVAHHAAPVMAR